MSVYAVEQRPTEAHGPVKVCYENLIFDHVPSVIMSIGAEPGSPEQKIFKDWLTQRYHAPSDDVNQPVDLAAAAKYEEIVRALLINVANDGHRPQWKQDSFFRRYAQ